MIYLTVNDAPSGVYKSQVIDTVIYLNQFTSVQLIAFISFRNFKEQKAKIKTWLPSAKVYPMVPGLKNWKKSRFFLKALVTKNAPIIARGPMAFEIARHSSEMICYDGRGAVKAELLEFPDIIPNEFIRDSIIEAEQKAVLQAAFRIAVSHKLVDYWKDEFNYEGDRHVVIPCTLSESFLQPNTGTDVRKDLGFSDNDIVLVYSGSIAGWQGLDQLRKFVHQWMKNDKVKLLFLSKDSSAIQELQQEFPDRIQRRWLSHDEVVQYLSAGDYGILIREKNITNQVASPVKFAEYLACGLRVIISDNLGDYSTIVVKDHLGEITKESEISFTKTSDEDRTRLQEYCKKNYLKSAYSNEFQHLLKVLTSD